MSQFQTNQTDMGRLVRLAGVFDRIPVSKSTWWQGVKSGKFPKPVKLGARLTCWRESDILDLVEREVD